MLNALSVRNIVLIDQLDLALDSGMTVLTGETGAGKSILLDALTLALGGRGDASLVRQGQESGQVVAMVQLPRDHPARAHLREGFSLDDAAAALATSKRTLQRRIEAVLGKTPLSYFQDLRVERAVHLLRTSRRDIEAIAAEVGYADGVTLRTLLRRKLGRGVRELRAAAR